MAFEIHCTACGEAIRVATFFPGKRVRCPNEACGAYHTLPEEHPAPEPLAPPIFPVPPPLPPVGEHRDRPDVNAAPPLPVAPNAIAGTVTPGLAVPPVTERPSRTAPPVTHSTGTVLPIVASATHPVSIPTTPVATAKSSETSTEPARPRPAARSRAVAIGRRGSFWPTVNLVCVLALVGTVAYFVGQNSASDDDPFEDFEPRTAQSQPVADSPTSTAPASSASFAAPKAAASLPGDSVAAVPVTAVPVTAAPVTAVPVTEAAAAPMAVAPPIARPVLKLTDLAQLAAASVVQVNVKRGGEEWLGSGFAVGDGRTVITNFHVIEGIAEAVVTRADRRTLPVEGFLAIAPERDLAVLRIISAEPLPALPLCAGTPAPGQEVATFGSPLGFANTITNGIVSGLRTAEEMRDLFETPRAYPPEMEWVQTSAPISKGNSGGPLLNLRGEVVGINTLSLSSMGGESLFFAVSVQELRRLLEHTADTRPFADLPAAKPVSMAASIPAAPPLPVEPQDRPEVKAVLKLEVLMDIYRRRTQLLREKDVIEKEAASLNSDLKDVNIRLAPIVREGRQIEQSLNNISQQMQNATDEGVRSRLDTQRELLSIRYEGLTTRANLLGNDAQRINGRLQELGKEAVRVQEQADKLRFEWLAATDPFGKWSRGEHEQALKTLTEWVGLDSACAFAYAARGFSYYGLGQFGDSLQDFERALKFDRTLNVALAGRAMALHKLDEKGRSRIEFKKALSVDTKTTFTTFCQAQIFADDRDWKKAIAYFRKSLESNDALCQHHLARLLAACPEEKYRKGDEAVKLAESACRLSNWKVWMYVDTLAAAYAETGDFVRAYEMQNRAAELAPPDAKAECLARRQQYSEHRPLRLP